MARCSSTPSGDSAERQRRATPALLTSTSTGPIAVRERAHRRQVGDVEQPRPPRRPASGRRRPCPCRGCAPRARPGRRARARALAVSRPMPPLAPVTTNRRPSWRGTSRQVGRAIGRGDRRSRRRARLHRARRRTLALDVRDGLAEGHRAADGAEPVLDLLQGARHDLAGRVAVLALGERDVQGHLELDQVAAVLVAHLVALGAGRERLERRPLARDVVEVDGTAAGQGGEQQLDGREVGVARPGRWRRRHRGRWSPSSGAHPSGGGRRCAGSPGRPGSGCHGRQTARDTATAQP